MIFQLGSTLLDACVLAILDRGDTYGYVLTQNVKADSGYFRIHAVPGIAASPEG